MTSLFESEVYQRRRATPCAEINVEDLLKTFALNWPDDANGNPLVLNGLESVTLTAFYRRDVSSRFWFTLRWIAADGQERYVQGQELQLTLWRAATSEARRLEKKLESQKKAEAGA